MERQRPTAGLARWAVAGILAGTLTFAIDRGWTASSARKVMRWRWIEEWTSWSGHVVLALAVVVVALAARTATLALPQRARERWVGARGLPAALVVVVLAAPLHSIGSELASGAWISLQWFAPLVAWAPTIGVLVATPAWLGLVDAHALRRSWWNVTLTLLVALALASLVAVDHKAVPGLYPGFHQLVEVAIAGTAVALVARVLPEASRERLAGTIAVVGTVSALSLWFASSPATRGALLLRSSFAQLWMPSTLAATRSTVLREMLVDMDVHAKAPDPGAPASFAGRGDWNIVLVVVDTMRADAIPPARPAAGLAFAHPGDTPRIDAWLERTYRFEHAYAPASATRRAMPAMLRSIEASEDPLVGTPLGERMADLGIMPLAAVDRYFKPARYPEIAALLDGFARVSSYDDDNTPAVVPAALEMAASASPQRFMLLVHLYTLHRPGFDGAIISRRASRVHAYRRSLVYLDKQFGALLDGLDALGLRERTLVVLTSDHGEGLGDHDTILHGPNVFDEDVRVPLAFEIPGQSGHVIRETVGTIDLVPTLVDLLGQPPIPDARGRSLLPLFVGDSDQPVRTYYFENWDDTRLGIVRGRDKVIVERPLGLAFRFDLAGDPDEFEDVHDVESSQPELLRRLVELEPELAAEELDDDETRRLLLARLREVDLRAPGPALDLLLRLVAIEPSPELVAPCIELFEQGGPEVRILVASRMLEAVPSPMIDLVASWLVALEGDPREADIVDALARENLPPFALDVVARRMQALAEHGDASSWAPWLRLVRFWPKSQELFGEPLSRMAARSRAEQAPRAVVQLLRQNLASMKQQPKRSSRGG